LKKCERNDSYFIKKFGKEVLPMKILHVCPRYWPIIGGVEEHVGNICERLALNNEVQVCTTDPSGVLPRREVINKVKINRFPAWAPNEAYFFSSQLKSYLKAHSANFDLVHAHNYGAFPALYAAQAKAKNKLFFTPHYHGTGHTFFRSLLHKPYRYWGKKIFEKADVVVCVSNYEMTLIGQNFERFKEKLVLVPNGLNLEEFRKVCRRKKRNRILLTVCRLENYKGVQYLIQVLPKLSEDIVLQVVGKGPYKRNLVELAKENRLNERVEFFEDLSRKEILQKYVDADLFVLLSEHESYGISVSEALAAGTPCVVANTSALAEWVQEKSCRGIEYPIDLISLKNSIEEAIEAGRTNVKLNVLDWDEVVQKLSNLYALSVG
jgi:glycosyltransferase involved in cell wall biosynthesis